MPSIPEDRVVYPWLCGACADYAQGRYAEPGARVLLCDETRRVVELDTDRYLCNRQPQLIELPGGQLVWNWAVEVDVSRRNLPVMHARALRRRDRYPQDDPRWRKWDVEAMGLEELVALIEKAHTS